MSGKISIRKIVVVSFWVLLGAGGITLLVLAVQKKNSLTCIGTQIKIASDTKNVFLDSNEIKELIWNIAGKNIVGKKIVEIDLKKIRKELKKHPWISVADVYFNKIGKLIIEVEEKQPLARVFMKDGGAFYIDDKINILPLSNHGPAQVSVFTNFGGSIKALTKKDSNTLKDISLLSSYIQKDSFTMAMIDQIYINDFDQFELIPKLGDLVITFGGASDIDNKFRKLKLFYSQVISNFGWNRYNKIALQYKDQVVATIKGAQDVISDSLRSKAMVKAMAEYSNQKSSDSSMLTRADEAANNTSLDMILQSVERQVPEEQTNVSVFNNNPIEKKSTHSVAPIVTAKPTEKPKEKGKTNNGNAIKTNKKIALPKPTIPTKAKRPKSNKPLNDY